MHPWTRLSEISTVFVSFSQTVHLQWFCLWQHLQFCPPVFVLPLFSPFVVARAGAHFSLLLSLQSLIFSLARCYTSCPTMEVWFGMCPGTQNSLYSYLPAGTVPTCAGLHLGISHPSPLSLSLPSCSGGEVPSLPGEQYASAGGVIHMLQNVAP